MPIEVIPDSTATSITLYWDAEPGLKYDVHKVGDNSATKGLTVGVFNDENLSEKTDYTYVVKVFDAKTGKVIRAPKVISVTTLAIPESEKEPTVTTETPSQSTNTAEAERLRQEAATVRAERLYQEKMARAETLGEAIQLAIVGLNKIAAEQVEAERIRQEIAKTARAVEKSKARREKKEGRRKEAEAQREARAQAMAKAESVRLEAATAPIVARVPTVEKRKPARTAKTRSTPEEKKLAAQRRVVAVIKVMIAKAEQVEAGRLAAEAARLRQEAAAMARAERRYREKMARAETLGEAIQLAITERVKIMAEAERLRQEAAEQAAPATADAELLPPTGLSAYVISPTRVIVSWDPSTDADEKYNLYLVGNDEPIASTTNNAYDDKDVLPGKRTYTVRVFAAGKWSGHSKPFSVTTTDTTPVEPEPVTDDMPLTGELADSLLASRKRTFGSRTQVPDEDKTEEPKSDGSAEDPEPPLDDTFFTDGFFVTGSEPKEIPVGIPSEEKPSPQQPKAGSSKSALERFGIDPKKFRKKVQGLRRPATSRESRTKERSGRIQAKSREGSVRTKKFWVMVQKISASGPFVAGKNS